MGPNNSHIYHDPCQKLSQSKFTKNDLFAKTQAFTKAQSHVERAFIANRTTFAIEYFYKLISALPQFTEWFFKQFIKTFLKSIRTRFYSLTKPYKQLFQAKFSYLYPLLLLVSIILESFQYCLYHWNKPHFLQIFWH